MKEAINIDHHINELIASKLQHQFYDGLYLVSMDHSPSEQLSGDEWYTSTLVLSAGVEHSALARDIAKTLRSKTPCLTKWSKATRYYKRNFFIALNKHIKKYPVFIFAVTAHKETIINSKNFLIEQLQAKDKYFEEVNGQKIRVKFGPFYQKETKEEKFITISENRAIMALFVAHFVVRMHTRMWEAANRFHPGGLNWNFFADKFPGPPGEDMELMFTLLLGRNINRGRILWGYFQQSDIVETDLLADNLAGCFSDMVKRKSTYKQIDTGKGLIYWEQWHTVLGDIP
ncbi:hypothetical protein [Desulfatibacillum aliphaticivorans]|uniref:hypothetical protein n=1 Tax=Desulfatibacillum aliphaticivorans TaxID=218208 RepID=UPI00040F97AD|nr:hypothetical protein [Desulfatibacillum aliphaticivorans]